MKVRPILFSAPMVRALLAGNKTQTRRMMKPQPQHLQHHKYQGLTVHEGESRMWCWKNLALENIWDFPSGADRKALAECCPYGQPGDLLYVREACRAHELTDAEVDILEPPLGRRDELYGRDGVIFVADDAFQPIANTGAAADAWVDMFAYRHKRGATVPPIHMPRWASRLTLRIADVRVERLHDITEADALAEGCVVPRSHPDAYAEPSERAICDYADLWTDINGDESWDANPWVWVITFEVIAQNVDRYIESIAA
jgi:hypothetical protein